MKYKEELINSTFSVAVPCMKGGDILWTCGKDNIIREKEEYKTIIIQGLNYNFLKKMRMGV